jgi:hypothetical protein
MIRGVFSTAKFINEARLRGKAGMTFCTCPLSRSLSGEKRTLVGAPHMSAFDPKRTFVCDFQYPALSLYHVLLSLGDDE